MYVKDVFDLLIRVTVEWLSWLKEHLRYIYTHNIYYTLIYYVYMFVVCVCIFVCICTHITYAHTEIDFNCHSGKIKDLLK